MLLTCGTWVTDSIQYRWRYFSGNPVAVCLATAIPIRYAGDLSTLNQNARNRRSRRTNQAVGVLNNPADRYYVAPMWGMLDVVAQGISRMLGLYEEVLRITHPTP